MRKLALVLATSAALFAGPALQARDRLTPDQRLAHMLEGRVAGEPQSCISNWNSRDMEVLDETAIVFRSGGTVWVNRPDNVEDLDSDDVLVTRSHGSQFCRLDFVQTYDRTSFFPTGFINLGQFVPYRRVRAQD